MKIVAAITSRWNSKRLPGKALMKIKGKPLIRNIIDRARECKLIDEVVVATTLSSPSIISYCIRNDIPFYAYQNDWNVLGRLTDLANAYKADILVYLWGDCPFIEPSKIDRAIEYFLISKDYFFDMSQPVSIMTVGLLNEVSKLRLSKHRKEYIHEYMMKCVRPKIEINEREDVKKANEMVF
jgi:spore coat polysaccharide biosynthesis protein SpsF (cytidylyltransferase family)